LEGLGFGGVEVGFRRIDCFRNLRILESEVRHGLGLICSYEIFQD
jgi:hypothetical protein